MYLLKRIRATLKGWKNQPSKAEVKRLDDYYKELTAEMTDMEAMELLDRPEKNDLFMLCRIAEYADLGNMKSILYAFKLGYKAGKGR